MRRVRIVVVGCALAAAAFAGFAGAADKEEKKEKPKKEVIQANIYNPNAGPSTGFLTVTIERYTTDEEARRYLDAIAAGGQKALIDLWWDEKPVAGRMAFQRTLGYDLRVARSIPNEKGRLIRLVTDRPIQGFELMRGTRSEDYPIGWIEIQLDAEGKGEGVMIAAAELEPKDGQLVFKSFATQPMKLLNAKLKVK